MWVACLRGFYAQHSLRKMEAIIEVHYCTYKLHLLLLLYYVKYRDLVLIVRTYAALQLAPAALRWPRGKILPLAGLRGGARLY
eukprot:COSAG06_NODE_44654_length_361_cov_1.377863_1_plen_83_part_00